MAVAVPVIVALAFLPHPVHQSIPRAAIIDQLSLTQPNPDFAEGAKEILEQAGYDVEYHPGEEVTVDFYRELPLLDSRLLILRAHSGAAAVEEYIGFFTAEPYDETKHAEEIGRRDLGRGRYYEGGEAYFIVGPDFVKSKMEGKFQDTIVILMGCYGLLYREPALELVSRGAKTIIGWDGPVSAAHTDAATERLLQHLVAEKLDPVEAVAETMSDVGPDPAYGSTLLVYP